MPELYTYPEINFVDPLNGSTGIGLNAKIEVGFTTSMAFSEDEHSELGRITDARIFYVVRQQDKEQINVPGSIVYNPITRHAVFTPDVPLLQNATYTIYVVGQDRNALCAQDTRGNKLRTSFITTFHTEAVAKDVPNTLYPADKGTVSSVRFMWNEVTNATGYTFEVSTVNDFISPVIRTTDVFEAVDGVITYIPEYSFNEQRYYWRVKQNGGEFSAPSQFFYKAERVTETPTVSSKPTIVSSYPARDSINTMPTAIKLKFDRSVVLPAEGTHVYLVKGEFKLSKIEDLDILPIDPIECLVTVSEINDKIVILAPTNALNYGTMYSVILTDYFADDVLAFTTSYEFVSSFIEQIQKTIVKYLRVDADEIYSVANSIAEDAFDMVAATYEDTSDATYNITTDNPPKQLISYVLYKTEYQLLLQKYMDLSLSSGTTTLADLTIQSDIDVDGMSSFLSLLKSMWQPLEDWLKGNQSGVASASYTQFKGDPDASEGYPDYLTRDIE